MIRNYLIFALRNIRKYPLYTSINWIGLAIGMAVFILITSEIIFEWQFDKFNKNYDQIYRVVQDYGGTGTMVAITHNPLAKKLQQDYPEVLHAVRVKFLDAGSRFSLNNGKEFDQVTGLWADPSLFDVFSYEFVSGNKETALNEPFSVVLTQNAADKFFPGRDALGQILRMNDTILCKVSAVIKDPPKNSHIQFEILVNLDSYSRLAGNDFFNNWNEFQVHNYIDLAPGTDISSFKQKIKNILQVNIDSTYPSTITIEPLRDIHFKSATIVGMGAKGSMQKIYILAAISIFILLIGLINYVNISTAMAAHRSKEVGIKKVIGADQGTLIRQFLLESVINAILTLVLAAFLIKFFLPVFNELTDTSFEFSDFLNLKVMLAILGFAFLTGILAGSYPAFFLSSFKPVSVLKRSMNIGQNRALFRKFMVLFQFLFSILLISGSILVYKQLYFLKNKDLGYNKERIYTAPFLIQDSLTVGRYDRIKQELLQNPNILNATISRFIPNGTYGYISSDYEGSKTQDRIKYAMNVVDSSFFDTWQIKFKSGSNFTESFSHDSLVDCIINQAAADFFKWDNPIGKRIGYGVVKSVVADFHFSAPANKIEPIVIFPLHKNTPRLIGSWYNFTLKLGESNRKETLEFIDKKFYERFPAQKHEFRFFEQDFAGLVYGETQMAKIVFYCTLLAIMIAGLGIFSLASFLSLGMTKEIGIRKTYGSSSKQILILISGEFIKLLIIANVIAIPISFYVLDKWLQNFAYTTSISWWIFLVAAIISAGITMLTILYHSLKAAHMNPVDALRYE